MTTGNTTLLGLALPVEGELDGAWGDIVNDSITSLLDSAIAGTTTLSVDSDVTLSTTSLAANEARQAVIRWNANGTVTRNITVPAQSKTYVIINDTAGTQDIVIRGAGPTTGVTVAAGERTIVAWTGSDFESVGGGAGGIAYVYQTTNYTASSAEGVLTNTSGGVFTVTLPAAPSVGDQVVVADSAGSWGTNNLTVGRNGSTISGSATDLTCDIEGASVQLVYDGTTWNVFAQVGGNGGAAVTLDGVQTLTNKTIDYASNTLTGVLPTSAIGVTVQAYDATLLNDADIGVTVQGYDATIVVDADIGSTVQAYDADTTKNDIANTFTATQTFGTSVVETKVAIAAAEIDLALGNYFTKSSVGTLTLTLTNEAATGSVSAFVLELANGASPAVTFTFNAGSTVTWAAATAPTLTASGTDVLAFFTHDGGTTWRGFVLGLGMA